MAVSSVTYDLKGKHISHTFPTGNIVRDIAQLIHEEYGVPVKYFNADTQHVGFFHVIKAGDIITPNINSNRVYVVKAVIPGLDMVVAMHGLAEDKFKASAVTVVGHVPGR